MKSEVKRMWRQAVTF